MDKEVLSRLLERMTRLGHDKKSLSKAAGKNDTYVQNIISGKSKDPGVDAIRSLCKVLGMTTAELLDGKAAPPLKVPIIGEITYADRWKQYRLREHTPQTLDLWTNADDIIAVRVHETSVSSRYQRGDVVLGRRNIGAHADNYIGQHCIIKTVDDQTYIKVLTRGSIDGHYTLRSSDPTVEDLQDVRLAWVAPIVAVLPQNG